MASQAKNETWKRTIVLSFQSLGVIYGRISITPLFVFGSMRPEDIKSEETLHEIFSFVFWTLTIVPLLKYALIVLQADDDGEGGTFALYSLLCRHTRVGLIPNDDLQYEEDVDSNEVKVESTARRFFGRHKSGHYVMLFLALFGACMTIGDGVLTPALSVFSASLGLGRSLAEFSELFSLSDRRRASVENTLTNHVPIPAACLILVLLFMLQRYGSHKIGFLFAPIITLWLLLITGVGLYNVVHYDPRIIYAVSPKYMLNFIRRFQARNWGLLSTILLCTAGSEAMFADVGHFSKRSIKVTFFCVIYPALVLCYAGQAAFISKHITLFSDVVHISESVNNSTIRHVFRVLSLFASAVGSQATITASFSIVSQCLSLGCFPRVKVIHTSNKIHGQVYIPDLNWVLMFLSIAVTVIFRNIVQIGNATGLAIICSMLATTCLMSLVIALYWEKYLFLSASFLFFFGTIEIIYLTACLSNFHKGAWYLVFLLIIFMTTMLSWHYGTVKKYEFDVQNKVSSDWLTNLSPGLGVSRIPGIGFIYTDIVTGVPAFFSHFITNLPAFHEVLVLVSFKSLPVPHVDPTQRYLTGRVGAREFKIYRCIVRHGYCDNVRNTDDFEDEIIRSIGEFICKEETDYEALTCPEGRMIAVGGQATDSTSPEFSPAVVSVPVRRNRVRFMLPATCPKLGFSVRKELMELVDARESGTTYFLGQPHLLARAGSSFLKRFLITTYIVLDKNCREPPVELNIPHAALIEVGMVYTI